MRNPTSFILNDGSSTSSNIFEGKTLENIEDHQPVGLMCLKMSCDTAPDRNGERREPQVLDVHLICVSRAVLRLPQTPDTWSWRLDVPILTQNYSGGS